VKKSNWLAVAAAAFLAGAPIIEAEAKRLGSGSNMPTISTTAAAGSITVSVANVTLRNLRLVANFAGGTTTAITVATGGNYLTLDGLHFRDTAATSEFLIHISVAAGITDLHVRNCTMIGLAGTMSNSILFAGASTDCLIEDTYFFVDSSDDVVDHLTLGSVNLVVRNNVIVNMDVDAAGYCLRYKDVGTGIAYNNIMAYNKDNAEISIGAGAWWFQNYAGNTIGESGKLDPANSANIP
jgi:hypothetical protein